MVVASEAMFAAGAILRVMTGSGDSVIRTDRFDMRRFREDDLPAMVGYRSDPQVARYQSWDSDWSTKDAVQFLAGQQGVAIGQRGEWVQLAIEERATGRLCGDLINDYEGIGGYEKYRGDLGLTYVVTMGSHGLETLEMTPMRMRGFRAERVTGPEVEWLASTLDCHSRMFETGIRVTDDERLEVVW